MEFVGQTAQQLHRFHLTGEVEKGRRLVKEYHRRLLGQCFCDHGLLPFAVAQCAHQPRFQRFYAHQCQGFVNNPAVAVAQGAEEPGVRIASHAHKLSHRDVSGIGFRGEHHANLPGTFMGREIQNVPSIEANAAFERAEKARKRAQERRFSHAIRAQQACELARLKGRLQVACHLFSRVSDG